MEGMETMKMIINVGSFIVMIALDALTSVTRQ